MMPTVLFITERGESTSGYYRCHLPAKGLRLRGYNIQVSNMLMELASHKVTGFDKQGRKLPCADVVIARKMTAPDGRYIPLANMIRRAIAHGQRVFFDLDDDPWTLPKTNPAYGTMTPVQQAQWYEDMEACSGIICATEPLAESVLANISQPVVHVCRSGIDATMYHHVHRGDERQPLRLGWMGTIDYRGRDLLSIIEPLRIALKDCADSVELWHLGGHPSQAVSVEDVLSPFPVKIVERPWVRLDDLPRSLAEIDAAIVPMEAHGFNESRSITTGLALMAAGVPFAVSSTAEYRRLWRMGGGYVVPNLDGWVPAVRMLTEPAYVNNRNDLRIAGIQLVRERFTPVKMAAEYVSFLHA